MAVNKTDFVFIEVVDENGNTLDAGAVHKHNFGNSSHIVALLNEEFNDEVHLKQSNGTTIKYYYQNK